MCLFSAGLMQGQGVRVLAASPVSYPVPMVDGNSPSVWVDGTLRVYTSTGDPLAMAGPNLFSLQQIASPVVTPATHYPIWIESVWRDPDGTIYGWYHHEPGGVCPNGKLTAPQIGAVVSDDGGSTFRDLGIVLSTGDPLNCGAGNGFFAGGHGDFSVILDQEGQYFYFLFDNYSGPLEHQGVATARMAFEDRANPVGTVHKYYVGAWDQPGTGGLVTPVFPAAVSWEGTNTDALWGPSIHWNNHLGAYVAVLNRSCCKSGWPQEGIYLSGTLDLSHPERWASPIKLMDAKAIGFAPGYYPQVVGIEDGGTDSLAGGTARLFIKGVSKWEIEFLRADEIPEPEEPPDFPTDPPSVDRSPRSPAATLLRLPLTRP
jgi:hypothetical protein